MLSYRRIIIFWKGTTVNMGHGQGQGYRMKVRLAGSNDICVPKMPTGWEFVSDFREETEARQPNWPVKWLSWAVKTLHAIALWAGVAQGERGGVSGDRFPNRR